MATDEAMRQLIRPQVPVLAGTDSAPTIQIGAFVITGYGASLHGELQLLVNEGMTPVQALVAATSAPARAFHLADRVLIRPKMRADLVSSGGGGSDA